MADGLTVDGSLGRRFLTFIAGAGMAAASLLTIQHFYNANFPASIYNGSFCDINTFFNCNSSAFSKIAHIQGVPMGWPGLFLGLLVCLGALFPSKAFEKTLKALTLLNALGVIALFVYSVFFLKSLCLLCTGYYLFSFFAFFLFWRRGLKGFPLPSFKQIVVFAVLFLAGAYGFHLYYKAEQDAQLGGVAARVVKEYYSLEKAPNPSFISPFMIAQSTDRFEDAPIRVIEYADFLCPDCLFMYEQLNRLKTEFAGKINIAFQFFPLDKCNEVVAQKSNRHPGACDLSYIAAHDPAKFASIYDEIFTHFQEAKDPQWRADLAKKYGVEAALTDPNTKDLVQRIMATGAEYEKTSDQFAHGIRSTPTLIVNNRMIIGTLPYPQLKAIFESLAAEGAKTGDKRFLENWVEFQPPKKK
ncbi:MAG: vitamin K epoxide reductase family protein [Candidatus Aminicenantes bacterium]|nr:vitamin K epoxide reductase family protein [Candidatus Aminicenantes bacterium]